MKSGGKEISEKRTKNPKAKLHAVDLTLRLAALNNALRGNIFFLTRDMYVCYEIIANGYRRNVYTTCDYR